MSWRATRWSAGRDAQGRGLLDRAALSRIAVGPSPPRAVDNCRAARSRRQPARAVERDRGHFQAPLARGDRRLSRQWRMGRQGRRLRHPGHRRRADPAYPGQPFGRGRLAALRDTYTAQIRRVRHCNDGRSSMASAKAAPAGRRREILAALCAGRAICRSAPTVSAASCLQCRPGAAAASRGWTMASNCWSTASLPALPKARACHWS